MTISLYWREYVEQFKEPGQEELRFDATDQQDIAWHYSGGLIEGWMRWIHLHEGMTLPIEKTQNQERLILELPDEVLLLT